MGTERPYVIALGGCGAQGEVTVRRLAKGGFFKRIVIADRDLPKATALAKTLAADGGAVSAHEIDVGRFDHLVEFIRGADVVVNETGPYHRYGFQAVRAAVAAKVNYIDINDDAGSTQQIFEDPEIGEQARKAQIAIIVGLGMSPGLDNLFAKLGSQMMDQTEEIHICGASNASRPSGVGLSQQLRNFTHAITFLDGKWVAAPPFSGKQTFHLVDTGDSVDCYNRAFPEPVTLPRFIKGVRTVTMKHGYRQAWMIDILRQVAELGLTSAEPLEVGGKAIAPVDFLVSYLSSDQAKRLFPVGNAPPGSWREVRVKGKKSGRERQVTYRYSTAGVPPANVTGMLPHIAAELLVQGKIKEKGLLAPESLDPSPYMREFSKMAAAFEVRTEEVSHSMA